MKRRTFTAATIAAGATGILGFAVIDDDGFSTPSESGANIDLRNETQSAHKLYIEVTKSSTGDTVFEREIRLEAEARREFEDAIGTGEFAVSVRLDGGTPTRKQLTVPDCGVIDIYVRVTNDGLRINRSYCG